MAITITDSNTHPTFATLYTAFEDPPIAEMISISNYCDLKSKVNTFSSYQDWCKQESPSSNKIIISYRIGIDDTGVSGDIYYEGIYMVKVILA